MRYLVKMLDFLGLELRGDGTVRKMATFKPYTAWTRLGREASAQKSMPRQRNADWIGSQDVRYYSVGMTNAF